MSYYTYTWFQNVKIKEEKLQEFREAKEGGADELLQYVELDEDLFLEWEDGGAEFSVWCRPDENSIRWLAPFCQEGGRIVFESLEGDGALWAWEFDGKGRVRILGLKSRGGGGRGRHILAGHDLCLQFEEKNLRIKGEQYREIKKILKSKNQDFSFAEFLNHLELHPLDDDEDGHYLEWNGPHGKWYTDDEFARWLSSYCSDGTIFVEALGGNFTIWAWRLDGDGGAEYLELKPAGPWR